MTIGADDFCCGEYPPLTSIDFLSPAPGVVDAPLPAQSNAGGSHDALEALITENARLRGDLAAARQARDTAQAQATHYRIYYTRSGW
jgi:hypothetical protein